MNSGKSWQLPFFASLYFIQGAMQSYTNNFQKPFLVAEGIEYSRIALITTLMLVPFSVKILFGYLSDLGKQRGIDRQKAVLLGLALSMICYLGAFFIRPSQDFFFFLVLILVAASGVAFFDASLDGLAIETASAQEQGKIQSAMQSGRAAGTIICSYGFGLLVAKLGYPWVFLALAVLIFIPLMSLLRMEGIRANQITKISPSAQALTSSEVEVNSQAEAKGNLLTLLKASGPLCLFALWYSFSSFGIDGLLSLFAAQSFQWNPEQIGFGGSLHGLGAILGALAAGFLLQKISQRRAITISIMFLLMCATGLGLIPQSDLGNRVLPLCFFVWGAAWAFQETSFITIAMEHAKSGMAATLFAFFMMISNLGAALGSGVAIQMVAWMQFQNTFVILGAALLPLLLLTQKISKSIHLSVTETE